MNQPSERILTCVYCGHEYPQGTPSSGTEVLTEHIKVCEKHPMRKTEEENKRLRKIAAHVPARIYIKAKEDAGFGTAIIFDWTVQDESIVDPTEAKLVRLINGIKSLRRFSLVEGYPTPHDHSELIGFAHDGASWGFAANPKYEPYEALEKCEKWLHGKLDELLKIVCEANGN